MCAQTLVEDALRTTVSAVGPAVRQGLLVVRKLDAGRAMTRADRQVVASAVRSGLQEAASTAARPRDRSALDANAVLFRDALEPYSLYAAALINGSPMASAWFFQAIFGRRPNVPRLARAKELLAQASSEDFAALAISEILSQAGPSAVILLRSLSGPEASTLLSAIGLQDAIVATEWSPKKAVRSLDESIIRLSIRHLVRVSSSTMEIATACLDEFGDEDPRTILGVAAVLIASSPTVISLDLVQATLHLIKTEGSIAKNQPAREERNDPEVLKANSDPSRRPQGAERRKTIKYADWRSKSATSQKGQDAEEGPVERPPERSQIGEDQAQLHRVQKEQPEALVAFQSERELRNKHNSHPDSALASSEEHGLEAEPSRAKLSALDSEAEKHQRPVVSEPQMVEETNQPLALPEAIDPFERGEMTAWAGGVLLLSLLHRLFAPALERPEVRAFGIGQLVLCRALDRAGCPSNDPFMRAISAQIDANGLPSAMTFWMPEIAISPYWARGLTIRRVEGLPGWRALCCARGRIVLALWSGHAPRPVREMVIQGKVLRRAAPLSDAVPRLIVSIEIVLRRLMRDLTETSVNAVLRRSGWMQATRTHIGITFDAALIDLSVRRAGLDIDPGWCPWLMRVVSIHYDYGGAHA